MEAVARTLKQVARKDILTELGMVSGMLALFLLGSRIISALFTDLEGHTFGIFPKDLGYSGTANGNAWYFLSAFGFYGLLLTFALGFGRIVGSRVLESHADLTRSGWLRYYRGLTLIQSFCAGLFLNGMRFAALGDNQMAAFPLLATVVAMIVIATWSTRFIDPSLLFYFLPVVIFGVGTFVSQSMFSNIVDHAEALQKMKRLAAFYRELPRDIFLGELTVKGLFYVCIIAGATYGIMRPLSVFVYGDGVVQGAFLNSMIAIYLVLAPYYGYGVSDLVGKKGTIFSIHDVVFEMRGGFLAVITWSWIIGNVVVWLPYLIATITSPRKKRPVAWKDEYAGLYNQPRTQNVAPAPEPPKVQPPSEETKQKLLSSFFGQEEALTRLWDSTLFPVLKGDRKFGNALLLGPTGVGKTETAKKIAEIFYGGRLLRFDLNQFSTEWEASRLLGSAPGYVGYNAEGGELIRGIRQKAPCVILLDEIEKVHPSILQVLLQLTGEGYAKDTEGRIASADRSLILMTSNIWPERANELSACSQEKLKKDLKGYITNRFSNIGPVQLFSSEFLGRVNAVVPYKPFSKEAAREIVRSLLSQTASPRGIAVKEGTVETLSEHIDVSEGYRGLKNTYEDIVERFLNQTATIPAQAQFGVVRKAGRLVTSLWTPSGEKLLNEESRVIVKGYDVDRAKLNAFEHSPLKEIVGQDRPIQEIVDFLRIAVSGALPDTERPMGIFLLAGPTGVGKTETARALSKWLFEGRMINKDMGEYKHPSDGRRLFGDQYKMGSLTKEVTELGSCVVLFDEIEKAHPEVFDTFLTLFDEGKMGDAATNLRVSFKNTIILMTTNLAPDRTEEDTSFEALTNDERRDLFAYHFRAELLGRINRILVYNELTEDAIEGILRKRVGRILARKEEEGVRIEVSEEIYRHLARQVRTSRYGVRGADEVIINSVGAAIAGIPEGSDTVSLTLEGDGRIAWHAS